MRSLRRLLAALLSAIQLLLGAPRAPPRAPAPRCGPAAPAWSARALATPPPLRLDPAAPPPPRAPARPSLFHRLLERLAALAARTRVPSRAAPAPAPAPEEALPTQPPTAAPLAPRRPGRPLAERLAHAGAAFAGWLGCDAPPPRAA